MHSPFRSESDVFGAVLGIALGVALAVAVGALTDPALGAGLGGVLVGVAIGLALRAGRGSLPEPVEIARHRDDVHRILVIANQTVTGSELARAIRDRAADHAAVELMVVSPALTRSRLELLASATDRARVEASDRLGRSLENLRGLGLPAAP